MRKDIQDIINQIDSLTKQLDQLRASCPHAYFEVKPFSWRPGAIEPRRICTECGSVVPGITADEQSEFWLAMDYSNNLSFDLDN